MVIYPAEISFIRRYLDCRYSDIIETEVIAMKSYNSLRTFAVNVGCMLSEKKEICVLATAVFFMCVIMSMLIVNAGNALTIFLDAQYPGYDSVIEAARIQLVYHVSVFVCYVIFLSLLLWFAKIIERELPSAEMKTHTTPHGRV